jgi:hypothetical protein
MEILREVSVTERMPTQPGKYIVKTKTNFAGNVHRLECKVTHDTHGKVHFHVTNQCVISWYEET